MPDIVGRLRPPRLASAPSSPALGEAYYDTGGNTLYWWNGTVWVASGAAAVSALPGSPVDGQEIAYLADATNGVVWHLKYRAASASARKWEFVGGSSLLTAPSGSNSSLTNTTGVLLASGPSITVPLAGDYKATFGGFAGSAAAGVTNVGLLLWKNGAGAGWTGPVFVATTTSAGAHIQTSISVSVAVADLLQIACFTSAGVTASVGPAWIEVLPRRVG